MIEKRKIVQLTLVLIGLVLVISTYFLYPAQNKSKPPKLEAVKEKINIEEEIKKLEKKEQAIVNQIQEEKEYLTSDNIIKKQEKIEKLEKKGQAIVNQIQEEKEYLTSDNIIKKQEKIEKLEKKEQAIVNQIQEEKEYLTSDDALKKDALKKLQTNLQKTSSSLAKKRSDLEQEKRVIKDGLESLQTNLQKTSSSLAKKRSDLEQEKRVIKDVLESLQTNLQKTSSSLAKKRSDLEEKEQLAEIDEGRSNTFKNVAYEGLTSDLKPFMVEAESAYIATESPEIVSMTNMRVTLYLKNRTIIITSDEGTYNKLNYDCTFIGHVVAKDETTTILADNLDLINSKEILKVYNNVYLTNDNGSLRADRVDYDFETRYYNISMFGDERVKVQLIQ